MTRCVTRSQHLYIDFTDASGSNRAFDFHCGKKKVADQILSILKRSWEQESQESADIKPPEKGEQQDGGKSKIKKEEENKKVTKADTVTVEEEEHNESGIMKTPNAAERPQTLFKVIMLFDFEAGNEEELTVSEGQILDVIDDSDPEWFACKNPINRDKTGLIPVSYCDVRFISDFLAFN